MKMELDCYLYAGILPMISRITPGNCGPSVSDLRYNISLSDCEEFATTYAEVDTVLRSISNA